MLLPDLLQLLFMLANCICKVEGIGPYDITACTASLSAIVNTAGLQTTGTANQLLPTACSEDLDANQP